ncbi:PREDICTED: chromosome transmission fidelity protein 8 homolog [Polistes dominula]|uniref:Chromosome transmission fidelity protein 8 homolog n=1 Tax=Polistes dominula TaxID=743375 RepID=A0ABM1JEU1_POLDO|nr:PREDICTED: chromosome transmission fidelity protein 8 homolog [Polistes dominula]
MIIPIKRDQDVQEWAIVELKGELSFGTKDITNSHYIGDFHFTKSGTPMLIIGIHVMYGKEMALTKPIAVLKKKSIPSTNQLGEEDSKTEYTIQAIVNKKIVFKFRPKPIINNIDI